jgi:hypothetical protein
MSILGNKNFATEDFRGKPIVTWIQFVIAIALLHLRDANGFAGTSMTCRLLAMHIKSLVTIPLTCIETCAQT